MAMGLCSFPGCRKDLVYPSADPLFGAQAAHIVAESKDGPRGSDSLPLSRRHLYDNLILLCPSHHDEIDKLWKKYPIPLLHEYKEQHEARMRRARQAGVIWAQEFLTVDYLNLPRVLMFPSAANALAELRGLGLDRIDSFRNLGIRVAQVLAVAEPVLQDWRDLAVPLRDLDGSLAPVGTVISFSQRFYTKNMVAPDERPHLTGNLRKDPHIWTKIEDGRRCYVRLDPAWVTTSTAYSNFRSGNASFAGLGVIVRADDDQLTASGIVVGMPMNPDIAWFYR